jgi:hypothetical protein
VLHFIEGDSKEVPYHALFCEVVSSLLGVRCIARLAVPALLDGAVSDAVSEIILDLLSDSDED